MQFLFPCLVIAGFWSKISYTNLLYLFINPRLLELEKIDNSSVRGNFRIWPSPKITPINSAKSPFLIRIGYFDRIWPFFFSCSRHFAKLSIFLLRIVSEIILTDGCVSFVNPLLQPFLIFFISYYCITKIQKFLPLDDPAKHTYFTINFHKNQIWNF